MYKLSDRTVIRKFKPKETSSNASYEWIATELDSGKSYLLTDIMKQVLDCFENWASIHDVVQVLSDRFKVDYASMKAVAGDFIKFCLKRKVIITDALAIGRDDSVKPGMSFDRYFINEALTKNRKTDVYIGYDKETGQKVVIKKVNLISEEAKSKEIKRLNQEFHIAKRLYEKSENYFIRPLTLAKDYVVFEYFNSMTLKSHLNHLDESKKEANIRIITKKILEAFSIIHANNMVHGDIHPGNILVDGEEIKVIDFGLANNVDLASDKIINNGGIHFFCPPERIGPTMHHKFLQTSSPESEVYQIGLIVYVILFGRVPFTGFSWSELAHNIKCHPIDYIPIDNWKVPNLYAEIKPILEKALDKSPQRRYPNIQVMFNDYLMKAHDNRPAAKA